MNLFVLFENRRPDPRLVTESALGDLLLPYLPVYASLDAVDAARRHHAKAAEPRDITDPKIHPLLLRALKQPSNRGMLVIDDLDLFAATTRVKYRLLDQDSALQAVSEFSASERSAWRDSVATHLMAVNTDRLPAPAPCPRPSTKT